MEFNFQNKKKIQKLKKKRSDFCSKKSFFIS